MGSEAPDYSIIVVGAGPAGCALASRLARSAKHPNVLLVEAGGKNDDPEMKIDAEKWIHRMQPAQSWGYETVPQEYLAGNVVPYDRGKGLGGSSSVNFSVWNIGPKDDYDEIARLVGDEEWKWDNAHERFKKLESFHGLGSDIPREYKDYLDPSPKDHGTSGLLNIGFPAVWEKCHKEIIDIFAASGHEKNLDLNSGNPLGLSVTAATAYRGSRVTAADLLQDAPNNLEILTNTQVARVIFSPDDPLKAIGIETIDGDKILATHEVILSAGSLDTAKLLLLSGIGDASQLNNLNIPVRLNLPYIGKGLKDHHYTTLTWKRAPHTTTRHTYYRDPDLQAAARKQWTIDQTGPLSEIACGTAISFFKSDAVYQSEEFRALPEDRKAHLLKPTVPTSEIYLNGPSTEHFTSPETAEPLLTLFVLILNNENTGTVTLQSSDPKIPALFDPKFFSHPFGRRQAIEATREVLRVAEGEAFQKDTTGVLSAPKSSSEEDILEYWRETTCSTWHMTGTVKMGKEGEEGTCVDTDFRVIGTKGLRVADCSVLPIEPK
jgi:choline dehydrogenase-like flavoprotein